MQTTTARFDELATSSIRKIDWRCLISFEKTYNASVAFFEIGTSDIGGSDFIKPADASVVQEWDKYDFEDYSDRVMSFEWTHEEDQFSGVTLSYGTLVLDNTDDYFTQGSGSAIDGNVKPRRPVRLSCGFDGQIVPSFIGLTEDSGKVDENSGTVTFRLVGFLRAIFDTPLDEESLAENKRTDELIDDLLQEAGLISSQYELDTGYNVIGFAVIKKREKLGEILKRLLEAEMGRLYMDELGIIRFKNRQNYNDNVVAEFSHNNIFDLARREESEIKNVIELQGEVRAVQERQDVGSLTSVLQINAGSTAIAWIEFLDPVTTAVVPAEATVATSSYWRANKAATGLGDDVTSGVTISASTLFNNSYKLTFSNSNAFTVFITELKIFGTPAKVINTILVQAKDQTSIDDFDEQVLSIENEFFQDQDQTESKAAMLLQDFKDFNPIERIEVLANPALQIGDAIRVHNAGATRDYKITRITGILSRTRLRQILDVKSFTRFSYFTIGSSAIGGEDRLAP